MIHDLEVFYKAIRKEVEGELNALKDNITFGRVVSPEHPYEYWVGMACAYQSVLESLAQKYKRVHGDVFEGE